MRRTDYIERDHAKVRVAEATERANRGVIRFCERRVAHSCYCCAQGTRGCAEVAKEVAVVTRHVGAHAGQEGGFGPRAAGGSSITGGR